MASESNNSNRTHLVTMVISLYNFEYTAGNENPPEKITHRKNGWLHQCADSATVAGDIAMLRLGVDVLTVDLYVSTQCGDDDGQARRGPK